MYGHNYSNASKALGDLDQEAVIREIGTQILANSVVCDAKAERCRRALLFSGIALALYLVALVPFTSMAYEANRDLLIKAHSLSIDTPR